MGEMRCEKCGARLTQEHGMNVCKHCGLVYGPVFVTEAEYYPPSVVKAHTPLTRTGRSIIRPTLYSKTPEQAARSRRLRRADTRSYTSKERHIYRVLQRIKSCCHQLSLPNYMVKTIEKKYVEAVEKKLTRRYKEDVIIASLIFLVCNHYGAPRLIGDICDAVVGPRPGEDGRTKASMPLAVRRMVNNVGPVLGIPYKIESPAAYTWKIASDVGIPPRVVQEANKFIKKYWQKHEAFTGRMPSACAGAVLAVFVKKHNLPITLQAISNNINSTEVTIRKIAKKLEYLVK